MDTRRRWSLHRRARLVSARLYQSERLWGVGTTNGRLIAVLPPEGGVKSIGAQLNEANKRHIVITEERV